MQEIKTDGLNYLGPSFGEFLKKAPKKRREMHERIAIRIKSVVNAEIEECLGDTNSTVRNWQVPTAGTLGGYAAVRPIKGEIGDNSPGAITNYLEGGHRIRPPGGGKDYHPRINVPYVKGHFFYEFAGAEAERAALEEAERFADELADMLEGKL